MIIFITFCIGLLVWKLCSSLSEKESLSGNPEAMRAIRETVRYIAWKHNAKSFEVKTAFDEYGQKQIVCNLCCDGENVHAINDSLEESLGDIICSFETHKSDTTMDNQKLIQQININGTNYGPVNGDVTNNFHGDQPAKECDEYEEVTDVEPCAESPDDEKHAAVSPEDNVLSALSPEDKEIVLRLATVFFNDTKAAAKFLDGIKNMQPVQICDYVRKLVKEKVISDKSYQKTLWEILHDNGLYGPGLRNWNSQV